MSNIGVYGFFGQNQPWFRIWQKIPHLSFTTYRTAAYHIPSKQKQMMLIQSYQGGHING